MINKMPVSGSEVSTYLLCQRKALYSFHPEYNLEPKTLGPALARGIAGHKALELFYSDVKENEDWDTAAHTSINNLLGQSMKCITDGDTAKAEMISHLATVLNNYYERFNDLKVFEILGVEELVEGDLPDSPNASFIGRVDLTIKLKGGKYKGETSPFDHKFVYNFWPDGAFAVNAQMPNYVWGVRNTYTNAVVKRAWVNQLRHRKDAVEVFNRRDIEPTRMEVAELIDNHSRAATQWVKIKRMTGEDARKTVLRNPAKFNCEYCPFTRLCRNELIGEDVELMKKTEFKPNSYGYAQREIV
jgi:hypothetical protein